MGAPIQGPLQAFAVFAVLCVMAYGRGGVASTVYRLPSTRHTAEVYRLPSTVYRVASTAEVYRLLSTCRRQTLQSTVYRLPCSVYRLPSAKCSARAKTLSGQTLSRIVDDSR